MEDLREIAMATVGTLENIASRFPRRSPAWKELRKAARQIKIDYILTAPDKKRLIVYAIGQGNRRFSELLQCSGLDRDELEELLAELKEAGFVSETREMPYSSDGRGRPARIFEILKNK